MQVPYVRFDPDLPAQQRTYPTDAGVDLFVVETVELQPLETARLPVNMAVSLPSGYYGMIAGRSSVAARGLLVYVGTVDQGYRGQLYVAVCNLSAKPQRIKRGERIAQLIVIPFACADFVEVESLDDTPRGERGWGSSGR